MDVSEVAQAKQGTAGYLLVHDDMQYVRFVGSRCYNQQRLGQQYHTAMIRRARRARSSHLILISETSESADWENQSFPRRFSQ